MTMPPLSHKAGLLLGLTALAMSLMSGGAMASTRTQSKDHYPDFYLLKTDPDLPKWNADEIEKIKIDKAPRVDAYLKQRPSANDGTIAIAEQDLRDVVAEYARDRGFTAQVNSNVRVKITNAVLPLDPDRFVQALQDQFRVAAYFDGDKLVVSDAADAATRLIPLGPLDFDRLKVEIDAAIPSSAVTIKYLPSSNAMLATGSAQLLAQLAGIVETARSRGDTVQVRFIRAGRTTK